ncbi:MAG: hypothetical protein JWR50_3423 [Mucilaginibacter sp.]|nr:hypothetical protein [Mucilaginibacter sp.]
MKKIRIKTYTAVLLHDRGRSRIKVISLSGKQRAIKTIMAMENCPRSAIASITTFNLKQDEK